jgi:hypothetical protein
MRLALRGRLMVGRLTLDQVVKVRVLAPQPSRAPAPRAFLFPAGQHMSAWGNVGATAGCIASVERRTRTQHNGSSSCCRRQSCRRARHVRLRTSRRQTPCRQAAVPRRTGEAILVLPQPSKAPSSAWLTLARRGSTRQKARSEARKLGARRRRLGARRFATS